MPKYNVSVPHHSNREEVIGKLRGFADSVRKDAGFDLTDVVEDWDDDGNLNFSFKAMGMTISGTVTTTDADVTVAGNLPLAAAMFRGTIETQFREKIQEALSR